MASNQLKPTILAWVMGKRNTHQVMLPAKRIVCPCCEGAGTTSNPSIDGNGITSSEAQELGDEFMESYFRGDYDVSCPECNGLRVIDVVDEDELSEKMLVRLEAYEEYERMAYLEAEGERRWGA